MPRFFTKLHPAAKRRDIYAGIPIRHPAADRGRNLDEDAISEYFANNFKGDCLLAVGDEELIKIHYHTNEPWKVLEYCASLGEIYDIVVEDMDRQARGLKG